MLRQLSLRPMTLLSKCTQSSRKSKLDFDKLRFIGRKTEEIACVAHAPSGGFELLLFLWLHVQSSLITRKYSFNRRFAPVATLLGNVRVFFLNTSSTTIASSATQ